MERSAEILKSVGSICCTNAEVIVNHAARSLVDNLVNIPCFRVSLFNGSADYD